MGTPTRPRLCTGDFDTQPTWVQGTYLGTLESVNHLDLVGWINQARYKFADFMGRSIPFKPGTFYLGVCDHLGTFTAIQASLPFDPHSQLALWKDKDHRGRRRNWNTQKCRLRRVSQPSIECLRMKLEGRNLPKRTSPILEQMPSPMSLLGIQGYPEVSSDSSTRQA